MKSIKLLLTSDLHLGIDRSGSFNIGNERIETFRRIMIQAARHDILLIAGDFIDRNLSEADFFDNISPELKNLAEGGTEIVYIPGPGELSASHEIINSIAELDGIYYLSDDTPQEYVKSGKGPVFIYGLQSGSRYAFESVSRAGKAGFHVGLFHADFEPGNTGINCNDCIDKNLIRHLNLDFYAMGKSHSFKMFRSNNRIIGAYPGSPEASSIDESGDRYVISMEIENSSLSTIKRLPVNTASILCSEIDCSGFTHEDALIEAVIALGTDDKIFNINLTGIRSFTYSSRLEKELRGRFRALRISDSSIPSLKIQLSSFCRENSLKGEIYRNLNSIMEKSNLSERVDPHALARLLQQRFSFPLQSEEVIFCDF